MAASRSLAKWPKNLSLPRLLRCAVHPKEPLGYTPLNLLRKAEARLNVFLAFSLDVQILKLWPWLSRVFPLMWSTTRGLSCERPMTARAIVNLRLPGLATQA